ncbi:MAG: AMP-binding protein, partial [Planctomycetes bacterium]|nr:AMP-binding protein [Planctomycetota bacterium]
PILASNYIAHRQIGSVGKIFTGVEIRIGENDEILARGDNIMMGYHKAPELTAEAIDQDGWLHTGDRGKLEGDFLTITGRIKNLMKSSNGKYVAPVAIEQKICASPLVDMAMLIAEGRTCVSCLLFMDPEAIISMQQAQGEQGISAQDFVNSPAIQKSMSEMLDGVNADLNKWEQVRMFHCITESPSVDNEQLTSTMKIRRHIIEKSYADIIEAMYEKGRE